MPSTLESLLAIICLGINISLISVVRLTIQLTFSTEILKDVLSMSKLDSIVLMSDLFWIIAAQCGTLTQ